MGLTLDFTWLLCPYTTDHVVSILLYFVPTVHKFYITTHWKAVHGAHFWFHPVAYSNGVLVCDLHHIVIGVAGA